MTQYGKSEFIAEMKRIIFRDFDDCLITDIDKDIECLKNEDSDIYDKERAKGNIIKIDHDLLLWLNGVVLTWNILHEEAGSPERIDKEDFIPSFKEVYDNSRRIPSTLNGFGHRCRL